MVAHGKIVCRSILQGVLVLMLAAGLRVDAQTQTQIQTQQQPDADQKQAIRDAVGSWYTTLCDDAMDIAGAYKALAPGLQRQLSSEEFQSLYKNTVHVNLTQIHLGDADASHAKVLVEEQRTGIIDGIAAMTWYAGWLTLERPYHGWQITGIDLKPEDIAGPKYRAEDHWQTDPERVAKRVVGGDAKLCPDKMQSEPGDAQALQVFVCTDKRTVLDMAHLSSGAWVVFRRSEQPLAQTNSKGAAVAAPHFDGP